MQWSSLIFLSLKTLLSGNVFQWQGSVLGPVGAMFWRQSNLFSSPFLPSTAGITSQGHPLATENAAEMGKRVQHPMVMLGIQMQPRSPRTEKTERNLETNPANNLPHRQETHMNPRDPCPGVCLSSHRSSGTGCFVEGVFQDRLWGTTVSGTFHLSWLSRAEEDGDSKSKHWNSLPSTAHLLKGSHRRAPEPLVNHIVVVIAQPQFHCYKSGPVLHAAKGREALLFVINACEKVLVTAGVFAGQALVEWRRPTSS